MSRTISTEDGEIKSPVLSNPAKLLRAYMQATGVFDAKQLADDLDIPVRTIQRLKLDIATATDGVADATANSATSAMDGAANSANDATDGVNPQSEPKKVSPTPPSKKDNYLEPTVSSPQSPPKTNFGTMFADPAIEDGCTIQGGTVILTNGTRQFWLEEFGHDERRLTLALKQAFGELQTGANRAIKPQIERTLSRIAGQRHDQDKRYNAAVQANAKPQAPAKGTGDSPRVEKARAFLALLDKPREAVNVRG